jgi:hypothetical protein
MKIKITRQWIFVIIWSAAVVLLANIPYIYGYMIAPADKVFMGDARSFIDTNTYLAWMHQAFDGNILFKNIYTTEPHARMLFHPLFLLLGMISRLTGLSLITVHGLARIFFGFALLIVIYIFISFFIERDIDRAAAFAVASISGSLAFLKIFSSINAMPESWFLTGWVEGNTFMSIYALPLFSVSMLMLIGVFYLMLRAFDENRTSYAVWAGLVCLLLVSTHFYDVMIVYPVLILYVLSKYFVLPDPERVRGELVLFGIMLLISVPSPIYNLLVSLANPVFKDWAWKSAVTLSPGLFWFFGALGILSVLSAIGIAKVVCEEDRRMFCRRWFLVVWALAVPFLIYAPLPFQRRLIEGAHVPIAILGYFGFSFLIERFNFDRKLFSVILIILLIPGNLFLLSSDMAYLQQNSSMASVAGFLDRDIYDAMKWLEANTKREDVVLADYELGNYIPAVSGNTVYIGHSPETIDFLGKWDLVLKFFGTDRDDEFRKTFLSSTGIKYVIYSWKERRLGAFDPNSGQYLVPVYRNPGVIVFKVNS